MTGKGQVFCLAKGYKKMYVSKKHTNETAEIKKLILNKLFSIGFLPS